MIQHHPADRWWVHEHMEKMPHRFKGPIGRRYSRIYKKKTRRDANLFLLDTVEKMPSTTAVRLAGSNDELVQYADFKAKECGRTAHRRQSPYRVLSDSIKAIGLNPPVPDGKAVTESGAIARMCDPLWWRRALRRGHGRAVEQTARTIGLVHKSAGIYSSDETVYRRREQKTRNRRMLEEIQAVNELGDEFTLAELSDLSVSNPVIRRGELMVRMAGFERVADELGHVGEFITLTAPSRFHSHTVRFSKRSNRWYSVENPAFDGSTPREAKNYLQKVWERIRAKLARHGITLYGFRVAEPHHDGCPHWHMLVFLPAWARRRVRRAFLHHGLMDTPEEDGAREHRVTFKAIDKAKGSATGYIAKYIAKNIDGFALQDDLLGGDPIEAAERVDAWASCWGIRQFQQLGGPPVTVWRELRRLDHEESGVLEQCRAAADGSNWAEFTKAMGGPIYPRVSRPVKAFRLQDVQPALWEAATGEASVQDDGRVELLPVLNKYGEPSPGKIVGVAHGDYVVVTRWHEWRIERGKVDGFDSDFASSAGSGDRGGNRWLCVGGEASESVLLSEARGPAFKWDWRINKKEDEKPVAWDHPPVCPLRGFTFRDVFGREASADPWSSVNNCTRGKDGNGNRAIENEANRTSTGLDFRKNVDGGGCDQRCGGVGGGYRDPTEPD